MHANLELSYSKIGLSLKTRGESIALNQIAENFPVQLLANTCFVLLSGDFELAAPERMKVLDLRFQMATGSLHRSALELLDLVIAFDNEVACLAASLGTPVWLLQPYRTNQAVISSSLDNYSKNVLVFTQTEGETWDDVFRRISFLRMMFPEHFHFSSLHEEKILTTNNQSVTVRCDLSSTNDVDKIFSKIQTDFLR